MTDLRPAHDPASGRLDVVRAHGVYALHLSDSCAVVLVLTPTTPGVVQAVARHVVFVGGELDGLACDLGETWTSLDDGTQHPGVITEGHRLGLTYLGGSPAEWATWESTGPVREIEELPGPTPIPERIRYLRRDILGPWT